MAQETIKRRKRKRGSEMSMKELQQLEFLNGVQAARYCGISPRTFYYYLKQIDIQKYTRTTMSNGEKILYRRNELDEKLRPKSLIQTVQFIHIQEQNQSLTAKKRKALGPQGLTEGSEVDGHNSRIGRKYRFSRAMYDKANKQNVYFGQQGRIAESYLSALAL